jgi:hypothetical protein
MERVGRWILQPWMLPPPGRDTDGSLPPPSSSTILQRFEPVQCTATNTALQHKVKDKMMVTMSSPPTPVSNSYQPHQPASGVAVKVRCVSSPCVPPAHLYYGKPTLECQTVRLQLIFTQSIIMESLLPSFEIKKIIIIPQIPKAVESSHITFKYNVGFVSRRH